MEELGNVPTTTKRIPITLIRENKSALREVDRASEGYQELLHSIQKDGVLQNITVRECEDSETKQKFYGLVDGLHRFTGAKDAGLMELECKVVTGMSDYEVLRKQIILNAQRVETRPVEYSRQLARMMNANLALTVMELAGQISKTPQFIYERMGLLKLNDQIAKLVDDGTIKLSNAFALAKLPTSEQPSWIDRAITQDATEFLPSVAARVKEVREANRKGVDAKPAEFVPVARIRKAGELKDEHADARIGPALIKKEGVTSAVEGFALAVRWMLHLDSVSIEQDRQKDEARKKEIEAAKARRKAEREQKSEEEKKDKAIASVLGVKD